jgi:hypothetical protein
LGDLRADPEGHLGVLHHPDQYLGRLIAVMISRSAARRLTWGAAPPCWSQTTAPSSASRLHLPPLGRVALHLITVGGSCAHLASLWLRFLPAMIRSPLQASELARQLGDPGGRIFDGLHRALVHDLDGPDLMGDLPVALSQLSQRASRVVWRDHAARDLLAKSLASAITSPRASSASLAAAAAPSAESYAWSLSRRSISALVMPHRPSGRTRTSA